MAKMLDFDIEEVAPDSEPTEAQNCGEIDLTDLILPERRVKHLKRNQISTWIKLRNIQTQQLVVAAVVLGFLAVVGNDLWHDRLDFKTFVYGVGAFFAGKSTTSPQRGNNYDSNQPRNP
jgi:hypothetical protein